jgi:hypothetical protein
MRVRHSAIFQADTWGVDPRQSAESLRFRLGLRSAVLSRRYPSYVLPYQSGDGSQKRLSCD